MRSRVFTAIAVAAAALSLAGCDIGEVDRFRAACADQGGFVIENGGGFWYQRYDCVVDNRIVYLPGFEG
jgi:hypothetical protein